VPRQRPGRVPARAWQLVGRARISVRARNFALSTGGTSPPRLPWSSDKRHVLPPRGGAGERGGERSGFGMGGRSASNALAADDSWLGA